MITTTIKRDGTRVPFDASKIRIAMAKAFTATGETKDITGVTNTLTAAVVEAISRNSHDGTATVESIQDEVERQLMKSYPDTAKAYILYREKRKQLRMKSLLRLRENNLKRLVTEAMKYFDSPYQYFIYLRTYSRWIEEKKRRETWPETVTRYMDFMREKLGDKLSEEEYKELHEHILKHRIMPSMRLLQFAGEPAARNNLVAYNCCFVAPTNLEAFRDIMYLSMCGVGVGWSVESRFVNQLPIIQTQGEQKETFIIPDSREGWCDAFYHGLTTWFAGGDVSFDYSLIRPAGARLKTSGGRASGPLPLRELLTFTRKIIMSRRGTRLTTMDVHDILCKVGQIVVSGGVRRSAMISISDLDDVEVRKCKSGEFWKENPQRCMANNSAAYNSKPSSEKLIDEWKSLIDSGTGERGIFNRSSFSTHLPERRLEILKGKLDTLGCNPCGEVILQSHGLCNLSTVICRPTDTVESLSKLVRLATILGTYQATLTDFKYVSPLFKQRAEEERLLGVSLTGQQDCPAVRDAKTLQTLKSVAIETNEEYARRFNINRSTAVTLVKPEGTVSEMVNSAPGVHPRYSRYYIRRVRISAHDPLFKMMRDQNVIYHPEVGQTLDNATTYVLEFPVKAPEGSVTNDSVTALQMLEYCKMVKENYCEHNASVTINVDSHEWIEVLHWVEKNWDHVCGLSFLPKTKHIYPLAPYEAVSEEEYLKLVKHYETYPIDFSKLIYYETDDCTDQKRELACAGGMCEA